MATTNSVLYGRVLLAIQNLFDDTSVTPQDAIDNLLSLIGEIEILIEALEADL